MQLTETIKLSLTNEQLELVAVAMDTYISTVNSLVSVAMSGISIEKYTTATVDAELPSAILNQCIRDAKSIVKKHYRFCHKAVLENRRRLRRAEEKAKKTKKYEAPELVLAPKVPVLKRPCFYVNNQNFKIVDNNIEFPVMVNGKSKRISVKSSITEEQKETLSIYKVGMLRVVLRGTKVYAQISYNIEEPDFCGDGKVMGVDLGLKCPAVAYTSDGTVKFYGNGRKNKYFRRQYKYLRKKLGKAKKQKVIKRISNKEQRIMKDVDHKMSRAIVNDAKAKGVSLIKMECLDNIRSTTRTSRKNNHSLHTWSFYRLMNFIEYKARLAGIEVLYVNPAYTSQRCPVCGSKNHAEDRDYKCNCGYHTHRDIVGARNICESSQYVGDSNVRHIA